MAAIFPTFDPNDFKQVLLKGARLTCDVCLVQVAVIEKANSLPEGWEMHRVTYPNSLPEYALDIICPLCLTDEQAYYAKLALDLELEKFERMKAEAVDWQFLVAQGGGIARKSDCEAWLIQRHGIDEYRARQITNQITEGPRYFTCSRDGIDWHARTAGRPAPTREQYPEIDYAKCK